MLTKNPKVVEDCLYDPNTPRDYARRSYSKGLAARAIAARYIVKAMEGSATHGDTVLERVEGKVASNEQPAGTLIQFNINMTSQLPEARVPRLINPSPPIALREPQVEYKRQDEYADADGSD